MQSGDDNVGISCRSKPGPKQVSGGTKEAAELLRVTVAISEKQVGA